MKNRKRKRKLIEGRERGKKGALHDALERESHIARKLKLTAAANLDFEEERRDGKAEIAVLINVLAAILSQSLKVVL